MACLAAALVTQSAHATGTCLSLTDPAGDERIAVVLVADVTPPDPGATDLVGVDAVATGSDVTATFHLVGKADPPAGLDYEYALTIVKHVVVDSVATDTTYELHAGIDGGAHIPLTGVYEVFVFSTSYQVDANGNPEARGGAAVTNSRRVTVDGSVDLDGHTVTVVAPASVFGGLSDGTTFTVTGADTDRGEAGSYDGPYDVVTAPAGTTLVAGDGSC